MDDQYNAGYEPVIWYEFCCKQIDAAIGAITLVINVDKTKASEKFADQFHELIVVEF